MLFQRSLFTQIESHLPDKRHTIITGARQVGKTSLLRLISQKLKAEGHLVFQLSLEDSKVLSDINAHPDNIFLHVPSLPIPAENGQVAKRMHLLIDEVHRAMHLYQGADRKSLLRYIGKVAAGAEGTFWRVLAALCEVLPDGSEDFKHASGLRTNKDSLIRESKALDGATPTQGALF